MITSLVLYDLSGTLTNPSLALFEATRRAMEQHNCSLAASATEVYRLRGFSEYREPGWFFPVLSQAKRRELKFLLDGDPEDIVSQVISLRDASSLTREQIVALNESFRSFYDTAAAGRFVRYPDDIMNHLYTMRESFSLGIVSNSRKGSVERDFGVYFDLFSVILSKEDVLEVKPSGEGIVQAMDVVNAVPEETVYVGDTVSDILAGKAAGCRTCALTSGMGHPYFLEKENPTWLVKTLSQFQREVVVS